MAGSGQRARPPRSERDELARAQLVPLAPGERPRALLISVAVCVVLAAAVLIGGLTIHDLASHGGSLPGAIFLAAVFAALALVVASTLAAASGCLLAIGLGGWLFWKLVRVMGRIQSGEHLDRD